MREERWAAALRLKDRRPYIRFMAVLDARLCGADDHRKWHGLVLHIDDPFWVRHTPPIGPDCRCIFQTLSARDLDRYGYKVGVAPREAK
ncbi:MAG: phage head morphogenesis protein [Tagaea sp.]|nr:phage head morphogenesis protein [Tagaea sp.]